MTERGGKRERGGWEGYTLRLPFKNILASNATRRFGTTGHPRSADHFFASIRGRVSGVPFFLSFSFHFIISGSSSHNGRKCCCTIFYWPRSNAYRKIGDLEKEKALKKMKV